jgi:hypothetical protein
MKFRDIFLPKIAHSDPEVRKKAVQQEKNPGLLKGVIKNDSDPDVRKLAEMRLKEIEQMG